MQFIKFFKKNKEILRNLIVIFILDYLFLFSLETVVPSAVMEIFNLNYFLIIIILLCLFYSFLNKNKQTKPAESGKLLSAILFSLGAAAGFTFLFILMGNGPVEIIVYLILTCFILFLFYRST